MEKNIYKRRVFLGNMVKAGAAGMFVHPVMDDIIKLDSITVNQVINRILAEVPGGKSTDTVDTLKSGSGDQMVTGIITTMFATVEVIRAAAKMHANFIIAHEPTFYNHLDDTGWVENNEVVKEKMALLEKYKIAVWRFHDHWHRMDPDGILHGFLLKTGWLSLSTKEENVIRIPSQSLGAVIEHLKQTLQIQHLRYIGDLHGSCHKIALVPGAAGGQVQLQSFIKTEADLLIVGEASEWETPEYFRDANALGKHVSLIVLGHAFSEEPGMDWLVGWLRPKIPFVPVNHIASGESFSWA